MSDHSEDPGYAKPVIIDHGDLKELTAHGGPLQHTDVPIGTPPNPPGDLNSVLS